MSRIFGLFLCLWFAMPARACDVALALTVDVSGSIDPGEYRLQMDGLAEALADPTVAEALVLAKAHVALFQWSGASRQDLTINWVAVQSFEDVDTLAAKVRAAKRPWRHFSTAIGEILRVAGNALESVPCKRRVIDVSGDGKSNEGPVPSEVRDRLVAVRHRYQRAGHSGRSGPGSSGILPRQCDRRSECFCILRAGLRRLPPGNPA